MLVVQLQDLETQIYQIPIVPDPETATLDPEITAPDPATTTVQDAANSLRHVVDKTKIVVDFVDNTTKERPPYSDTFRLSVWLSVRANIFG